MIFCSKVTENEELSENLFKEAYDKLDSAVASRTGNTNIELCNFAMTLVAQAIKRERMNKPLEQIKPLIKQAKLRLKPLLDAEDSWSYFCLSRLYAALRKEEKCKKFLLKCSDKGNEFYMIILFQLKY